MNANNKEKKEKKIQVLTVIYSLIVIIVVYLAVIGVLLYGLGINKGVIKITAKIIPYPAAVINCKNLITANELAENLQSIRRFYESQDFSSFGMRVDFSTDDGQKRLKIREKELLNKMIEDKTIEILTRQKGIKITAEEVSQNVKRKLDEYGTEGPVKENLLRLYGWTLDDFEKKIVRSSLYAEELEKLVVSQNKEGFFQPARQKIEKAKNDLDQGVDFAEAAKKYSDGSTAQEGGELGWFKKDQLIAEVSQSAFSLAKEKRSDIIESALGYHIIEVEDKKTENNEEMTRIRQIFARRYAFADWLDEQIKEMKIYIPLKDFYWDKKRGVVEFSSQDLREFEKSMRENFSGDASVIF